MNQTLMIFLTNKGEYRIQFHHSDRVSGQRSRSVARLSLLGSIQAGQEEPCESSIKRAAIIVGGDPVLTRGQAAWRWPMSPFSLPFVVFFYSDVGHVVATLFNEEGPCQGKMFDFMWIAYLPRIYVEKIFPVTHEFSSEVYPYSVTRG